MYVENLFDDLNKIDQTWNAQDTSAVLVEARA
jgi:hypothetical protein